MKRLIINENEKQQDPITHPCQAGSRRDFIWDILSVDMSNSRAGNIIHATSTHPHLQSRQKANERMIPGKNETKKAV